MNKFLNEVKESTNFTYTENGAITHKTSMSALLDLFGLGGAYRHRSDEDCIVLFKKAFKENEVYALKCLFYLRDAREGQGERRFFRVCMKWLASYDTDAAKRNLKHIVEFGRWDDLYLFIDTPLQNDALAFMKEQLELDVQCKTPSLLAKWLKSENTSSYDSRRLGNITREYFKMSHKQYRKTLSILRERINVLERLMSAGRWEDIEFDKIPSKAGMKYRNAFARHDLEREKAGAQTYKDFAKDENTTVNAKVLYPYECVEAAFKAMGHDSWGWYDPDMKGKIPFNDTNRLMVNKYWDNLADYINEAKFDGLAVVDTSGSMSGTPINVAISLGMYCAEKVSGPYKNHFITFSSNPDLIEVEGVDFCDKVIRMSNANWGMNTNIEAVFDLILETAIKNKCSQDEIPKNLIIISDMEFDYSVCYNFNSKATLLENIAKEWELRGYKMPNLIFWNVDARQDNIPMKIKDGVTLVSGFSTVLFEQIMQGKTAEDLMFDKLSSERYAPIQ